MSYLIRCYKIEEVCFGDELKAFGVPENYTMARVCFYVDVNTYSSPLYAVAWMNIQNLYSMT